jgi:hypothetical protein
MPYNRKLLTIFFGLILLCSSVAAQKQKTSEIPTIRETEWVGKDFGVEEHVATYRFEKEGILAYTYNGSHYRNGTWKQKGNKVHTETNNKYAECRFVIIGDQMTGSCWNTARQKWKRILYKYDKPN